MSIIKCMFCIHNECNKICFVFTMSIIKYMLVFTMSVIKYLICIHNEYNKIYLLVFTMSVIKYMFHNVFTNECNKISILYSQ